MRTITQHHLTRWTTIQTPLPEDAQFLPGIAVVAGGVVCASIGTLGTASALWEMRVTIGPITVADDETVIGWAMDDLTPLTVIARRLT